MQLLESRNITLLRTDTDGTIELVSDGQKILQAA